MDINELNKKQLILLTLLITFVVSIATGIVTVSLMKQMPTSVPQTINNIIQRTIEKVSTPTTPATVNEASNSEKESTSLIGDGEVVVPIYQSVVASTDPAKTTDTAKELGQGIIISDVGLVLVDTSILTDKDTYKIVLNKNDFEASVLKKFSNGFTILKITKKSTTPEKTNSTGTANTTTIPSVDKK